MPAAPSFRLPSAWPTDSPSAWVALLGRRTPRRYRPCPPLRPPRLEHPAHPRPGPPPRRPSRQRSRLLAGGFVARCPGPNLRLAQVVPPADCRAIVVLPAEPLSTTKAAPCSRPTISSLMWSPTSSPPRSRPRLRPGTCRPLAAAMSDCIHEPYRAPSARFRLCCLPWLARKPL